jgi:hypothetical protein
LLYTVRATGDHPKVCARAQQSHAAGLSDPDDLEGSLPSIEGAHDLRRMTRHLVWLVSNPTVQVRIALLYALQATSCYAKGVHIDCTCPLFFRAMPSLCLMTCTQVDAFKLQCRVQCSTPSKVLCHGKSGWLQLIVYAFTREMCKASRSISDQKGLF